MATALVKLNMGALPEAGFDSTLTSPSDIHIGPALRAQWPMENLEPCDPGPAAEIGAEVLGSVDRVTEVLSLVTIDDEDPTNVLLSSPTFFSEPGDPDSDGQTVSVEAESCFASCTRSRRDETETSLVLAELRAVYVPEAPSLQLF